MFRLLVAFVLFAGQVGAQEYDDPAVVVCELLVRPQFEVEQNVYKRVSSEIAGSRVALGFEWGVPGAKPKQEHIECPFRMEGDAYVLDIPEDQRDILTPASASIAASGLYPVHERATALALE